MQDAMYSAIFGAMSNEYRLNNIANNLANVNTTGYKKDTVSFIDTFRMLSHDVIMEPKESIRSKQLFPDGKHLARPRLSQAVTDFSQGSLKMTGGTFDVAINGDGFFRLQSPDGDMYTRNGHFRLTAEGALISEQGWPVMSEGGEIVLPPNFRNVTIAEDGRIFADGVEVDQIAMVALEDTRVLEKHGQNLYRVKQGQEAVEMEPENSTMSQGFLEAANVDPIYEMVNMIEAQRQFEAYQKIMQASDTLDREANTRVGRKA